MVAGEEGAGGGRGGTVRFHDLDALRAMAMLLGVYLHAALSFTETPVWPAQDVARDDAIWGTVNHAIHGFRMPLFFFISGFFTAMMAGKRGLRGLVEHRARRVLVPLLIGLPLFSLPVFGVAALGSWKKSAALEAAAAAERGGGESRLGDGRGAEASPGGGEVFWEAVASGDVAALRRELDAGADAGSRSGDGGTALSWAALRGHLGVVRALVEAGANPDAGGRDGATPLLAAAFFGRVEVVEFLVDEAGASVNRPDANGSTPLDAARSPWPLTSAIAKLVDVELDREATEARQAEVAAFLESRGGRPGHGRDLTAEAIGWLPAPLSQVVGAYYFVAVAVPLFNHLWFLYYLLWLVAGYVLVAWWRRRRPGPDGRGNGDRAGSGLGRVLVVGMLATFPLQAMMTQSFGPDTAAGPFPWPPVLAYYGVFFGAGAWAFGRPGLPGAAAARWLPCLALAAPAFAAGVAALAWRDNPAAPGASPWPRHLALSACATAYAWLVVVGLLGFFRRFCPAGSKPVRYLSDASYWLYLAHLAPVIALQVWVSDWPLPAAVKIAGIIALTVGALLLAYDLCIRYTWAGAMLNGRKSRGSER